MNDPYVAPLAEVTDPPRSEQAVLEQARRELIATEARLRWVGVICWLVAAYLAMLSALLVVFPEALKQDLSLLRYPVLCAICLVVGYGFLRVQPWVRVPGAVLAAFGLLSFPVGTVVAVLVLLLLYSPQGRRVLTPDYRAVILATPELRNERSGKDKLIDLSVIVLLVLLVGSQVEVGERVIAEPFC
ncbi:MAG: hypothetical protein R3F15_21035 [Lysobacterales bacterium]